MYFDKKLVYMEFMRIFANSPLAEIILKTAIDVLSPELRPYLTFHNSNRIVERLYLAIAVCKSISNSKELIQIYSNQLSFARTVLIYVIFKDVSFVLLKDPLTNQLIPHSNNQKASAKFTLDLLNKVDPANTLKIDMDLLAKIFEREITDPNQLSTADLTCYFATTLAVDIYGVPLTRINSAKEFYPGIATHVSFEIEEHLMTASAPSLIEAIAEFNSGLNSVEEYFSHSVARHQRIQEFVVIKPLRILVTTSRLNEYLSFEKILDHLVMQIDRMRRLTRLEENKLKPEQKIKFLYTIKDYHRMKASKKASIAK
jgi:hypothetical protein